MSSATKVAAKRRKSVTADPVSSKSSERKEQVRSFANRKPDRMQRVSSRRNGTEKAEARCNLKAFPGQFSKGN